MSGGVVGIDLSLTGTGLAHYHPANGWGTRLISTTGKRDDSVHTTAARLEHIVRQVTGFVYSTGPSLVVVEKAVSVGRGMATERAGLFWHVVLWLRQEQYPVAVAMPSSRQKYATGKGGGASADKAHVLAAAIRRYPDADISNDNIADAVVLAAMGSRWRGAVCDDPLPVTHTDALLKVAWPTSAP